MNSIKTYFDFYQIVRRIKNEWTDGSFEEKNLVLYSLYHAVKAHHGFYCSVNNTFWDILSKFYVPPVPNVVLVSPKIVKQNYFRRKRLQTLRNTRERKRRKEREKEGGGG